MGGEGIWNKADGDILFSSETNLFWNSLFGDGNDGALSVPSGTTTLDNTSGHVKKRYSSMSISNGATLTITQANNNGYGLFAKCLGDCTIDGTLNLNSKGYNGGSASGAYRNGNGYGPFGGQGGVHYNVTLGASKGGGNASGPDAYGGQSFFAGSGGGRGGNGILNSGSNGGAGGGLAVIFVGGNFSLGASGTITTTGASGASPSSTGGGGGGGGGGMVLIVVGGTITDSGTKIVTGGSGAAGSGANRGYNAGGGGSFNPGADGSDSPLLDNGNGGSGKIAIISISDYIQ